MPVSSNRRQRVISFATPKVADLVIVERVDCSKNVSSAGSADDTAYGTAHPDTTNFANFNLAFIKDDDDEQGQFQLWYYVKDRSNQDDYNWEFQAAGGTSPHYDTVVRTYVTLRADYDEAAPAVGNSNGMPSGTVSLTPFDNDQTVDGVTYDTDYVLFEKRQVRSGEETLDSLYVVEQHVFVKRVSIYRVDVDDVFSGDADASPPSALISKETLWHQSEDPTGTVAFDPDGDDINTITLTPTTPKLFADNDATINATTASGGGTTNFWGVDIHGIMREGRQLTDNWYIIAEKQVVGTTGLIAEFTSWEIFSWPAVLQGDPESGGEGDGGFSAGGILLHQWTRRDGGVDTYASTIFKREEFNGPTKMVTKIYWQNTPFEIEADDRDGTATALADIISMHPLPISISTPLVKLNVKPCLHDRITLTMTTGTEHPIYVYGGATFGFERTNYLDWPASLVVMDSQQQFRGGYLRTQKTAYRPDTSTLL